MSLASMAVRLRVGSCGGCADLPTTLYVHLAAALGLAECVSARRGPLAPGALVACFVR